MPALVKVSLSVKLAACLDWAPVVETVPSMPEACLPDGSVALEAASAPVTVKANSAAGASAPVVVL